MFTFEYCKQHLTGELLQHKTYTTHLPSLDMHHLKGPINVVPEMEHVSGHYLKSFIRTHNSAMREKYLLSQVKTNGNKPFLYLKWDYSIPFLL